MQFAPKSGGGRSAICKPPQIHHQYQPLQHEMGTRLVMVPARLSPRADLWVYLLASSTTALAALITITSGTTSETMAITAASLALFVALFVSLGFRFQTSRDWLTRSLGNRNNATMELAFALFAMILWCVVAGVALTRKEEERRGRGGRDPGGDNLYYATHASFAILSYIAADVATVDDPSGVVHYDAPATNLVGRSWILLAIHSLVLSSCSAAAVAGDDCAGPVLRRTDACRGAAAGIAFGAAGALASAAYGIAAARLPRRRRPAGVLLSVTTATAFAANAALQTAPGALGSEPSGVFWASWACVGLSLHLCVCHIERCLASMEKAPVGGDSFEQSERAPPMRHQAPLMQPQVPLVHQQLSGYPVPPVPVSGSTTYSSDSTYHTTSSSASSSDDDGSSSGESPGDGSDSDLVLLLPPSANDESALTFDVKPGAGNVNGQRSGTRYGGSRSSYNRSPPGPTDQANRSRPGSRSSSGANNRPQINGGDKSIITFSSSMKPSVRNTTSPPPGQHLPSGARASDIMNQQQPIGERVPKIMNERELKEHQKNILFEKNFHPNQEGSRSKTTALEDNSKAIKSTTGSRTKTIDKSGFEKNLHQYLKGLGLPQGIFSTLSRNYMACDSRLWLIDNSDSMKVQDSHLIGGKLESVRKKEKVSRWEELRECVAFHAKMAARCWMPTKFWLVNDPGPSLVGLQKFALCWNTPREITGEMNQVRRVMTAARPDLQKNPLVHQIRSVHKGVSKEAPRLSSQGKHVTFIISTQGIPTDRNGKEGADVIYDFEQALASLTKLPVKIVLRMCTSDTKVMDMYNLFDSKFSCCDVLGDYWGEALEVYLHNSWLAYGIGIHRMREAGMAWGIIDVLDERPLSVDEIHQLCKTLFIGEDRPGLEKKILPHPRVWKDFMRGLAQILKEERQIWNPVLKEKTPWINLSKLDAMYGGVSVATDYSKSQLSLTQILQRWSHEPPSYKTLRPLDVLLVTVPDIFPKSNPQVEDHEYFDKWKTIARDAFNGSGDELNELLKRAVRKAKLFLHPDKLPTDLSKNQLILFKTIWNAILEQETATLKKD